MILTLIRRQVIQRYSGWVRPSLKKERDEFKRVSNEDRIPMASLLQAAAAGKMVALSADVWRRLDNTESAKPLDLATAKRYAKKYGRDPERIIEGFYKNDPIPAPIVMRDGQRLTCVAGNTRLMLARALRVRPVVLVFDARS